MLVIQAYEAKTTPEWIRRCMQTVEAWARSCGHDYRFSPVLFDRIPDWFRQRCGSEIGPMTDLGRLLLMQSIFDEGEDAVIWVDADVVVFDPANLQVPPDPGFLCIDEVTVGCGEEGVPVISSRTVNGALLAVSRGNAIFTIYRKAMESMVSAAPVGPLPRTVAGPQLLTRLARQEPVARLTSVGLFTPSILNDLAQGEETLPRAFSRAFGHRVAAANLCHFYRDTIDQGDVPVYDDIMLRVIDRLVDSRGEIVNRYLRE